MNPRIRYSPPYMAVPQPHFCFHAFHRGHQLVIHNSRPDHDVLLFYPYIRVIVKQEFIGIRNYNIKQQNGF